MKHRCIIVDDEYLAQNVLQKFISAIPTLELVNKSNNAIEAISYLHENHVDIIFLDIDMPEISGLEMLKTLEKAPKIILTTAYSQYAIEGYEYGVVDYLLKPIPFERFLKAVNRAVAQINTNIEKTKSDVPAQFPENILIKQDYVSHNLKIDCILYIEAYGNYLKIYTSENKYIIREKLHLFEKKLPPEIFIQVHKSYIISIKKLTSIEGNFVKIGEIGIPIGSYYKSSLLDRLKTV